MEYKKVNQSINNTINDKVRKLQGLFPSAVKDGEVDFEALREELGQFTEVGNEKYELTWAGKKNAKKIAREGIIGKTLKFVPEDSKNADLTENLYIEGDNLEIMKLLYENYYGAIKVIYIDPPYNTGNDFVYNDSFGMNRVESDMYEGLVDKFGERYSVNNASHNRYHANWLNMMLPRLTLAKDLLSEDGVIFISIDDNEVDNLTKMCNEIFGESNFIANMIWQQGKKSSGNLIGINHEYMLVYAKNRSIVDNPKKAFRQKKQGLDKIYSKYNALKKQYGDDYVSIQKEMKVFYNSLAENDPAYAHRLYCLVDKRGLFQSDNSAAPDKPETRSHRPLIHPITGKPTAVPAMGWRFTDKTLDELVEKEYIYFGEDEKKVPRVKRYLKEYEYELPATVFYKPGSAASSELQILMGDKVFDNPKDRIELQRIIGFCTSSEEVSDDIIMDFFSGSSSSAHAVMQLNADDGGRRKYIMAQLPETISENNIAYKDGYKNICEIGKERIRRAGDKIKSENPDTDIDIGFKVFRVADTNIKWNSLMDEGQLEFAQIETTPDQLDFMPDANDIDIVYELMLRQRGVALSESLEQLSDIGSRTYLYASSFLVCLETEITKELISKLAELDPLPIKFIFRDSAFKDDIALKDETFRRLKALVEKNAGTNKPTYTVEFI